MDGSQDLHVAPPSTTIQSLPQEVLLHVFSFLTSTELSNTVANVCTHWASLQQDPSLYTTLTFDKSDSTEHIVKCIKLAPWLEALSLTGNDFNTIFTELLKNGIQVHKLTLHAGLDIDCRPKTVDGYFFLKVFKTCPKMHTLKLKGFEHLSTVFYKELSCMFTDLRVINLISLKRLCYGTVLKITVNCPRLEEIRVHGNYQDELVTIVYLTDIEMITICDSLRDTLRVLHLDYSEWSAKAFDSLKKCQRLRDLGFYRASKMTTEVLLMIESFTLRKLRITCCRQPTEDAWIHLISSPGLKNLESLELTDCSFTNKVAIAIGGNLVCLNILTMVLMVKCFCIPDYRQVFLSGIKSIMKGCRQLKHLQMSCMDLDTQCALIMIPAYLPGLKTICVVPRANPEARWISILKSRMPGLIMRPKIAML